MKKYGQELILDLNECDASKFNRIDLEEFFISLCDKIDMERGPLHFWDYEGFEEEKETDPDHIVGTTAIQFIRTSNITVHCLDRLEAVLINIFSCKDFDSLKVMIFVQDFFKGKIINNYMKERFV